MSADARIWFEDGQWHVITDRCKAEHDHTTFDLLRAIGNAEQCIDHDLWWTPGAVVQPALRTCYHLDGWGYYREKPNL